MFSAVYTAAPPSPDPVLVCNRLFLSPYFDAQGRASAPESQSFAPFCPTRQFFNEELGVSFSSLAFWGTAAVCVDAVTDPLVGGWTDNLRSEHGRRRPFLFFAPVFVAATLILNGCPPDGVDYGVWYGVFTILFFVLDDVYQVPYDALGYEMTEDHDERTSLFGWKATKPHARPHPSRNAATAFERH